MTATMNGLRSARAKSLIKGSCDRRGCCRCERTNHKGNRKTPNTPTHQHSIQANTDSFPVALSHVFAKCPHHDITAPEEPLL